MSSRSRISKKKSFVSTSNVDNDDETSTSGQQSPTLSGSRSMHSSTSKKPSRRSLSKLSKGPGSTKVASMSKSFGGGGVGSKMKMKSAKKKRIVRLTSKIGKQSSLSRSGSRKKSAVGFFKNISTSPSKSLSKQRSKRRSSPRKMAAGGKSLKGGRKSAGKKGKSPRKLAAARSGVKLTPIKIGSAWKMIDVNAHKGYLVDKPKRKGKSKRKARKTTSKRALKRSTSGSTTGSRTSSSLAKFIVPDSGFKGSRFSLTKSKRSTKGGSSYRSSPKKRMSSFGLAAAGKSKRKAKGKIRKSISASGGVGKPIQSFTQKIGFGTGQDKIVITISQPKPSGPGIRKPSWDVSWTNETKGPSSAKSSYSLSKGKQSKSKIRGRSRSKMSSIGSGSKSMDTGSSYGPTTTAPKTMPIKSMSSSLKKSQRLPPNSLKSISRRNPAKSTVSKSKNDASTTMTTTTTNDTSMASGTTYTVTSTSKQPKSASGIQSSTVSSTSKGAD